jgi:putative transposase
MIRTFKYRMWVNEKQERSLNHILDLCRNLYNCALEDRIAAYKREKAANIGNDGEKIKLAVSAFDQSRELPYIKALLPEYKEPYAQTLTDVLRRLDLAYQAFFRRVKAGDTAGFPRFKGRDRYDSFSYPQKDGYQLEGNRLHLSKIGWFRIKLHRSIKGDILQCRIKRTAGKWYVYFVCEIDKSPTPIKTQGDVVAIDMGLTHMWTDTDGGIAPNPRWTRASADVLAKAQRSLATKKRGSNRRAKAKLAVQRVCEHIANQREDHLHKLSRSLVNRCKSITHEKLSVKEMIEKKEGKQSSTGLRRGIADVAWATLFAYISYKAEEAGTVVVVVDPKNTTQMCSACGRLPTRRLTLRDRIYTCEWCGHTEGRDKNAAKNIMKRGRAIPPGVIPIDVMPTCGQPSQGLCG